MSREPGREIGPYRILEKLGEGGMGAVYRALDTRLERQVALKVLPETVTGDPDKVARFQREARLLAALNHPGIGAIYDLEQEGDDLCLVLELVEGETLEQVLKSGPISAARARRIFSQAAEALQAAHERKILHRDLKPGNIMLGSGDRVKLLDFGLAKELKGSLTGATEFSTQEGTLIGTAPYLAPEQIRGESADVRTEVWALGCCLYEALTGQLAFAEANLAATFNAVLSKEPEWSLLPEQGTLLSLLQDCLRKDPAERLLSMTEFQARLQGDSTDLVEVVSPPSVAVKLKTPLAPAGQPGRRPARPLALLSLGLALLGFAAGLGFLAARQVLPSHPPSSTLLYLSVPLPSEVRLAQQHPVPAVRPDGQAVVIPVQTEKGRQLLLHLFGQEQARLIAGSEGAAFPFFSPQGDRVGFLGRKGLSWVPLEGGPVKRVVEDLRLEQFLGAAWSDDDRIVYATTSGGLHSVAAVGGEVRKLLAPNPLAGDAVVGWPRWQEDTLYFSRRSGGTYGSGRVEQIDPATGRRQVIANQAYGGWPAKDGALLVREGAVLQNDRVLLPRIWCDVERGEAGFAAANGTLAYLEPGEGGGAGKAFWFDAQGELVSQESFDGIDPRLSPDGEVLCYRRFDDDVRALWFRELSSRLDRQVTHRGNAVCFVFAGEGEQVAVSSDHEGPFNIYTLDLARPGKMSRVTTSPQRQFVKSWTSSGIWYEQETEAGDHDLFLVAPGGEPRVVVSSPFDERHPSVSLDETLLAFVSNESGLEEVYLRELPEGSRRRVGPGRHPLFLRDGRLVYEYESSLYVVDPKVSRPAVPLLKLSRPSPTDSRAWDASPDGKTFLFVEEPLSTIETSYVRVRIKMP